MDIKNISGARLRIISNSEIDDETDCWNWKRHIEKNGYAKTRVDGKNAWVHRLSYQLFVGEIPAGTDVCHKCDNRKCVNPNHLFLGTRLENMRDAASKNRIANGERLPQSKLSDSDRESLVEMAKAGIKYSEIGNRFGICKQTAGRIAIKKGVMRNGIGK